MKIGYKLCTSLGIFAALAFLGCSDGGEATGSGSSSSSSSTGGEGGSGGSGGASACGPAKPHPHDPAKPEWSYHGAEDGPDMWGTLMGYETCGTGMAQTPIDIVAASAMASAEALTFSNYDKAIPVELLNNGHTLQVGYTGTMSAGDPQITYAGKTYYLAQFHWHSTSEHTIDGKSYPFEAHFVHRAADDSLAVVGVFFEAGAENAVLSTLMKDNPGHEMETSCSDTVTLDALLPANRGFFHYDGSLTTPPCDQGLNWFVMQDPLQASDAQETEYQTEFNGTTNRPIQPLNGRMIAINSP